MPTALPSLVSALTALALLAPASALAIPPKPAAVSATWGDGGPVWGRVVALPRVARPGDPVHIHGLVVGGPAADPWWSCSQYHGWTVNGTSGIAVVVPPTWSMNANASDNFGNKVATLERDGGELPPYGWEERVSDTCYCAVTDFGASGGCESREVQPEVFFTMDAQNPREGNVQFASPGGATGWAAVEARFTG
ncbi:MAG: hypothetical protein KC635_12430, partial [Myxococcales bacterium]|nr:hypothetical protein [Myxococcales bacterium]